MLTVNVQGGTGAGRRTVQPDPEPWVCVSCARELAAYWTRCPTCASPRSS